MLLTDEEKLKLIYSLDDFDYSKIVSKYQKKECAICGKEFIPHGRNATRQRYCNRTHIIDCQICGKPIKQDPHSLYPGGLKLVCKGECSAKLRSINTKEAMMQKYGYENISQVPEFKERISASLKAKSKETTKKVVATLKERYGGVGTASPIIREKIENTMKERYGVANPSFNEEIRKKISEILQSPEVIAKYEETALSRWGVRRPAMAKEVIDKMKQTTLERYGVECSLQTDYAKQRLEEVSIEKYGVSNPLDSDYARDKARESLINEMHDHNTKISKINQMVADQLKEEFGIESEFEYTIGRKWYDLKIKDSNILIEIDPTYTHSNLPNHWNPEGLAKDYHVIKTKVAEENGFRCIHIFDWDDISKIANTLNTKERVYARQCTLECLTDKQVKSFINENHLQGDARGAQYCYGLIYKGELISAMTFGKPRYNKKYQWELLRLCTKSGKTVVGGPSKMFSQFLKDANPNSIISYCDRAKFKGDVYKQLGFNLHHISEPAKVWSKGTEYITDNLLRQRGYDQLFNANYGKGTSNEELMIEDGWRSIYDCGQLVFEWAK